MLQLESIGRWFGRFARQLGLLNAATEELAGEGKFSLKIHSAAPDCFATCANATCVQSRRRGLDCAPVSFWRRAFHQTASNTKVAIGSRPMYDVSLARKVRAAYAADFRLLGYHDASWAGL